MSVAIIPMAQNFGWSPSISGLVQSSFFWGYMASQVPGGYLASSMGGRRVLPTGVGIWSLATVALPFLAVTMPGEGGPSWGAHLPWLLLITLVLPDK